MLEQSFDIIVIGGGPGGYVAAIRASQLGLKTALIEKQHLGGICLNWGCIPTKALLRSAEVYHLMKHADDFGLAADNVRFDFDKIIKRSRGIANQLSGGIAHLMKKNKVTVFDGHGMLLGKNKALVTKDKKEIAKLSSKHIILATGARARVLAGKEPDGDLIWSYKEALSPKKMPKSLLVVGSGAIGIEFASFYNTLGTEVTVVEAIDRILPAEDAEISAFAQKQFEKQGIKIITNAELGDFKKNKNSVTVSFKTGKEKHEITVDAVIMAVGIVGNIEDIGLENTKVKTDRTHVVVNEWSETDEKGIYAIGDLAGSPWLAHKASHEAIICVEKITGQKDVHPLDTSLIAGCTYCMPQIASIGLTEAVAKEKGYQVKIGRFPFMGNGKAIALGETEGMVKTIFDAKTGELLGAHMVGAEVTELINGFGIAKTLETTEAELIHTIFPHPTLSEMMHESVLDAYDRVLHF